MYKLHTKNTSFYDDFAIRRSEKIVMAQNLCISFYNLILSYKIFVL